MADYENDPTYPPADRLIPNNPPLTAEHVRNCHERFLALMMGSASGQTSSARVRAFTQLAGCDDVGTLSGIRHDLRRRVTRGDPEAMVRIDQYMETARDELIAAQVVADTSVQQDRALALAHTNAVTRLQVSRGEGNAPQAPADHSKREMEGRGGGLAAAAVSYSHIASGRWAGAPPSRLEPRILLAEIGGMPPPYDSIW